MQLQRAEASPVTAVQERAQCADPQGVREIESKNLPFNKMKLKVNEADARMLIDAYVYNDLVNTAVLQPREQMAEVGPYLCCTCSAMKNIEVVGTKSFISRNKCFVCSIESVNI